MTDAPGGIECLHDFPEQRPPDDNLEAPGGWNVAEVIIEMLARGGYVQESVEPDDEHHCWFVIVNKDDKEYWVRIYVFDDVTVSAEEPPRGCLAPPGPEREPPEELLRFLWAEMEQDGRFRDLEWLSHAISGLGLVTPVGEPGPRTLAWWARMQ